MKEDLQKRQCLARVQGWKLLIERDLFESYSQRINACFNYLDDNGEGFFTLKDVTDRGKFVFSYLGNPLENKNPYAAMDCFDATILAAPVKCIWMTLLGALSGSCRKLRMRVTPWVISLMRLWRRAVLRWRSLWRMCILLLARITLRGYGVYCITYSRGYGREWCLSRVQPFSVLL